MSRTRRRRSKPPNATTAQPDPSPTADSGHDGGGAASEIPADLTELTIAEQEAEELLAERRRQVEEAQVAAWERWTSAMESQLSAERERCEQLEVALGRSKLAHADAKRAAEEAARTLAESRAEADQRAEKKLRESHSRVEAQLAESASKLAGSQAELADVRRELTQTRSRLEAELKEAEKDRDAARAEVEATKEVAERAERIGDLEAQLEAERARVADLETATELLESQRATAVRWAEEAQRAAREESRRHSAVAARDS